MKRFYVEYTPIRRGLTGREYLAQHIDEVFPNVKFYSMFSNGIVNFGYLEGDDESLCNVLSFCEHSFAMKRLFVEEFRGAAKLYWIPMSDYHLPGGIEMPEITVEEYLLSHSIDSTSSSLISDAKLYKIKLLKEKVKREFFDYNDMVANMAKEIMLLSEYRDTLDGPQTARLNAALDAMKLIYSPDDCLDAIEEDIVSINAVMPHYYSTKTAIQDATSIIEINNIDLIGN